MSDPVQKEIEFEVVDGIPLLPRLPLRAGGRTVTLEDVNRIRDEEEFDLSAYGRTPEQP